MEKQQYEDMKSLRLKVESGIANFKERNIWNIIQKRKKQGKKVYFKN